MDFEDVYILLKRRFISKFDSGHKINHSLIVAGHAYVSLKDFPELTNVQKDAIIIAALFHDFNDHKFISKDDYLDVGVLLSSYISKETIDLVVKMIDLVSCSKNGDTIVSPSWMVIPRYADRIEAMGSIGLWRAISYGKHIGRPFVSPDTPLVYSLEELDKVVTHDRYLEYISGKRKSSSTLELFYDKILHLSVPEWLNSKTLENLADGRTEWLRNYIVRYCCQLEQKEISILM